ncbi:TPA: hypothetical protein ACGFUW_002311 [Flavobacterium psychrophilum]|uniref:hypothetical protein n=1 Tax=Flavobacterium psychrophilum TaxID=96345 RepID=UPI002CFA0784|nr:hypothetical protein [Flavobacterium psychrophilum]
MNLYYISIGLDYDDYIVELNDLRYEVQKHFRFISNYFSKAIRKHKYKTDGTYNMIAVEATEFEIKPTKLVGFGDVIRVNLPFDRNRYEKTKGTEDCSYYLELLEQGFKKASEFKEVPLETLLNIVMEFKQGGCKNEWLHKKKRFKEDDLEIILTCEFTTNCFQLIATINQISTKKELISDVVIKTEPDEICFEGMYKDILINDDKIIITDKSDSPRIIIEKTEVFNGKLNSIIVGDEEIRKILSFEL